MRGLALLPALCLAAVGCSTAALAEECDGSEVTQHGMNICAAAGYRAADARLHADYSEIMNRLSDDANARKLLQESQRAWIAFRDAECLFSSYGVKQGTVYPMVHSSCLKSLTEARVETLGHYLNCVEGDLSCPVPTGQ